MDNRELAQSERQQLCNLFDDVGPDHPTLCAGWTTAHLAAHLVNRERNPLTGPGLMLGGPFERYTESTLEKTRVNTDYADLVERVRTGPPSLLGPFDGAVNMTEYFVHHEDVRRAAPGAQPRSDVGDLEDALWDQQGRRTRLLIRRLDDLDLTVARPSGEQKHIGGGSRPVTLVGPATEIVLFLSGRREAAVVQIDGEAGAATELREGKLGL